MSRKDFEQVISQALQFHDQGQSAESIIAMFPEHRADLEAVFKAVSAMREDKDSVMPNRSSLKSVIDNLNSSKSFSWAEFLIGRRVAYVSLAILVLAAGIFSLSEFSQNVNIFSPAISPNEKVTAVSESLPAASQNLATAKLIETGPSNIGSVDIAPINKLAQEMDNDLAILTADINELETLAFDASLNRVADELLGL
ncbi:MAG: hypothetical protein COT81_05785 [Candidatus Buchananbacteria bacterium CG10_big_fil_rev_8_21_14_0_10_42_9]|uniref:Uncharacterized protein n=1 Tax=Candidatus Buchananbacteria bacterium CG10_big_fil_rev_8_21_14_0_10_42_9 TaxID=1974526 RepID=A0A2H0VZP0_9BACT|nr:MAG: hypothetical protein COT81_05785 [Candidatus Buchananbacteria bacterium CG10_big_fil_rev_8_21_14_0_10_42_9]